MHGYLHHLLRANAENRGGKCTVCCLHGQVDSQTHTHLQLTLSEHMHIRCTDQNIPNSTYVEVGAPVSLTAKSQ